LRNTHKLISASRSLAVMAAEVGLRLRRLRSRMNQGDVATLLGLHKNSIGRFERGEQTPSGRVIEAYAKAFDVEGDWIEFGTGRGPDEADADVELEAAAAARGEVRAGRRAARGEVAAVPIVSAQAEGGPGLVPDADEHLEGTLPVRVDDLRRAGCRPADARAVVVRGDSMAPELVAGDVVVVDLAAPPREGLWVLALGDALLVKRVQRLPGGRLRLVSCNPAYAPLEVAAADVRLIGRVVWRGGGL
jgi:phage repressor protein C with HTH and peptisase S24 domain